MIEKELKKQGFTASQLFKPEWVDIILKKYTFATIEDLWAAIGYGALTANRVIPGSKRNTGKLSRPKNLRNRWPNWMTKR